MALFKIHLQSVERTKFISNVTINTSKNSSIVYRSGLNFLLNYFLSLCVKDIPLFNVIDTLSLKINLINQFETHKLIHYCVTLDQTAVH